MVSFPHWILSCEDKDHVSMIYGLPSFNMCCSLIYSLTNIYEEPTVCQAPCETLRKDTAMSKTNVVRITGREITRL